MPSRKNPFADLDAVWGKGIINSDARVLCG
jgi:hypothetical protein